MSKVNELFSKELKVVNMGLESFHKDLKSQNVDSIHMDWRPAAGGNKKMLSMLDRLKAKK
jgi:hypothetical protein